MSRARDLCLASGVSPHGLFTSGVSDGLQDDLLRAAETTESDDAVIARFAHVSIQDQYRTRRINVEDVKAARAILRAGTLKLRSLDAHARDLEAERTELRELLGPRAS